MPSTPFVVYAMPRSSSYWLSRFLAHNGRRRVEHEVAMTIRTPIADINWRVLSGLDGAVETAADQYWRLVRQLMPNARVVVLTRPIPEIVASIAGLGISLDAFDWGKILRAQEARLQRIHHRVPNVLAVTYADLRTEDGTRAVWDHCGNAQWDADWWAKMAEQRLERSYSQVHAYTALHWREMQHADDLAQRTMRQLIRARL